MSNKKISAKKKSSSVLSKVKKIQNKQLAIEPMTPVVVKKIQPKKMFSKKTSVVIKKNIKRKKPEVIIVNEVSVGSKDKLNLPNEVYKEFLVVHRCQNCEHMPVSVGKIVTLFSVLIFLLSFSILVQIGQINMNSALAKITQSVAAVSYQK